MATTQDIPPGIEERYLTASATSDMTVVGGMVPRGSGSGAANVILAAGMSKSRLGQALIRLRAEWDGCDKPRKWTDAEILARAAEVPNRKGKPDVKRAVGEAALGYAVALRKRALVLRGREEVLGLLTDWAAIKGIDPDLLSPAIFHWLAPLCPVCDGHGKRRMPDAPVLGPNCHHCGGAGKWPRPDGAWKIHEHIADCIGKARGSMAGRLR